MKRYESYKPSGISWIGEIPSHWETPFLFQFCNEHFISNKNVHHQNLLSLSYGKIVRKDINKIGGLLPESFDTYQIVKPGSIVLRLTDLQNDKKSFRVGLAKEEGIITSAYVALEVKDKALPEYFYLMLHMYDIKKVFYSMGGGLRQSLNFDGLRKLKTPIPPLEEQKKIVEYLSDVDCKISNLLSAKKKRIELQRELLENLIFFGGKSENATVYGWDSNFSAEWNIVKGKRIFEEIDLKGFENERFIAVTQDKALIYKDQGDVNFVTASDPRTQKLVCPGQFVISLRSFQGGLELSSIRGVISPAYYVFKLKNHYDTKEMRSFFRFLFKSRPYISLLNSLSDSLRDGKSIKFSEVAEFNYPLPSTGFLRNFNKEVSKYDILNEEYQKLSSLLTEYKQRLIADAVTGQIKID